MCETKRTNLGRKQRERKIRGKDSTIKKVEVKKIEQEIKTKKCMELGAKYEKEGLRSCWIRHCHRVNFPTFRTNVLPVGS